MNGPCFTMKVNIPLCPCRKTTPLRSLCATQKSPSNICSLASSSVSHFWTTRRRSYLQANSVEISPEESDAIPDSVAPSSLFPCQFGEKCSFSPPLEDHFCHHCCKETFQPSGENVYDPGAQCSFLSVTFVNSESLLSCAHSMVYGVLSARVPEQKPIPVLHVCIFFAYFVISSTPMPSSRLGLSEMSDGEAHIKRSSAGALQRGAALRLFLLARSLAIRKRIPFALVTMSVGSRGGQSACNSRSVSLMSTTCATILPLPPGIVTWAFISSSSGGEPRDVPTRQVLQSVYFEASASSQCTVKFVFQQRRYSNCCGMSCPSMQLPAMRVLVSDAHTGCSEQSSR